MDHKLRGDDTFRVSGFHLVQEGLCLAIWRSILFIRWFLSILMSSTGFFLKKFKIRAMRSYDIVKGFEVQYLEETHLKSY